jgi:hypothetical protein
VPAQGKYPNALRERAMRLVAEAREREPDLSLNAAVLRIGPRVGVHADTLRGWASSPPSTSAGRRGPRLLTCRRSSSCRLRSVT